MFNGTCRMDASASAVHISLSSDGSTDNFPVKTAPDEYVLDFQKSSEQDPLLRASGAPYSKKVVKSSLNDITYGHFFLS